MNEKKTLAALTTRGQPKETLARIRPAFRKHPRPHTKDRDRMGRVDPGQGVSRRTASPAPARRAARRSACADGRIPDFPEQCSV